MVFFSPFPTTICNIVLCFYISGGRRTVTNVSLSNGLVLCVWGENVLELDLVEERFILGSEQVVSYKASIDLPHEIIPKSWTFLQLSFQVSTSRVLIIERFDSSLAKNAHRALHVSEKHSVILNIRCLEMAIDEIVTRFRILGYRYNWPWSFNRTYKIIIWLIISTEQVQKWLNFQSTPIVR